MNNATLTSHAKQLMTKCIDVAKTKFHGDKSVKSVSNLKLPELRLDLKGKTAGMYRWQPSKKLSVVRLNKVLYIENFGDFDQTIIHEMAHYISLELFGYNIQSHGREWKAVMRALGVNPERCHSYDVTNAVTNIKNKFKYTCDCNHAHIVTLLIHNRISSGRKYKCNGCKSRLTLVGPLHSQRTQPAQRTQPIQQAAQTNKPKQAPKRDASKPTKKAMALALFTTMNGATRPQIIEAFMTELEMSKAGAATYYANCKKETK